jgi:hypothetical protein
MPIGRAMAICAADHAEESEKPYSCRRNVENKFRFTRYVEQTEGISIVQARIPGSWKKG